MKIGIDIGGSHIGVGLVDNSGKILLKEEKDIIELKKEYENNDIKELLIRGIVEFINKILKDTSLTVENIEKIGIASPGNIKNGVITDAGNLGIKEFDMVAKLKEYYNIPIILKNDAKCAGIAEKEYGALKQYDNSVFITIGTGIGGAVFWNRELLEPKQCAGFEVGHMIIQKDGIECKCGSRGCFEKYASITALKEMVIEQYGIPKEITGLELFTFIKENEQEEKMQNVISKYVDNLAIGISNLINIFEPDAFCLGGSIVYYSSIILSKLICVLTQYCFDKNIPEIVFAQNKNDAGIIGASC